MADKIRDCLPTQPGKVAGLFARDQRSHGDQVETSTAMTESQPPGNSGAGLNAHRQSGNGLNSHGYSTLGNLWALGFFPNLETTPNLGRLDTSRTGGSHPLAFETRMGWRFTTPRRYTHTLLKRQWGAALALVARSALLDFKSDWVRLLHLVADHSLFKSE